MNSKIPIGIVITAAAFFCFAGTAAAIQHAPGGVTVQAFKNVSRLVENLSVRQDALEKQNQALEADLDALRAKDRALESTNKELNRRLNAMTIPDVAPLQANLSAVQSSIEKQSAAISNTSEKTASLASTVASLKTQGESLKSADAALKSGHTAQEDAIAKLKSSQAAYASGVADLRSVDQSLRDQNASLAQRLGALQAPDLAPFMAEVAAIKVVNDTQAETINGLVSKEEALMVAATGLQAQIDDVALPNLAPVENALSALGSRQKAYAAALTSMKQEMDDRQAVVSELIERDNALMVAATGLQAQFDGLDIPDVTAIEANVAALKTASEELGIANAIAGTQLEYLVSLDLPQLSVDIDDLKGRLAGVSRSGDTLRFDAMNIQVTNGSSATDGKVNGLGNLIIGYNEAITPFIDGENPKSEKSGSHNLIVGKGHNYGGYGGIVTGLDNVIAGNYGVAAATRNQALGDFSTVTGGQLNTASGGYASVSGGFRNLASENSASVSGGQLNVAAGGASSVSGGFQVHAPGNSNWAAGKLTQRQ